MTIYEAGFKLQHECPFNDLSRQYPSVVISHWCNNETDVLEITCDDIGLFQRLRESVQNLTRKLGVRVSREVFTGPNQQLVTQNCACVHFRSTSPTIERNHCLELQPTIYKGGWEWYRVIAFSERDIKNLFRELDAFCKVEVLSRKTSIDGSVRENLLISVANLLGALTEKQSQALSLALESGYYRVPKGITTDAIAKALGIPRTTYEEHLRKAEGKVLSSVAPYIRMRPPGTGGPAPGASKTQ